MTTATKNLVGSRFRLELHAALAISEFDTGGLKRPLYRDNLAIGWRGKIPASPSLTWCRQVIFGGYLTPYPPSSVRHLLSAGHRESGMPVGMSAVGSQDRRNHNADY
jgi:hypothetical protein